MDNYTCAQLVRDVKRRINDEEYSTDDIIDYLNDALFEVVGEDRYPFLEKSFNYSEIGNGELILPLDFQSVIALFIDGVKLKYIPNKSFFEDDQPNAYTVFSDNRVFYNVDGCGCPQEATLLYLAKPYIMSAGDTPPFPIEFKEILVLGALYRIEQASGNYDFAAVYQQRQDELIVNLKLRYNVRQQSNEYIMKLPTRKIGGA